MIRIYEWRILEEGGTLRLPPSTINFDIQARREGFLDENLAMENCRQVCRSMGNDAPKRLVLVTFYVADDWLR